MTDATPTKNATRAKVYLKAAEYLVLGKSTFSCCAVDLAVRHSPIKKDWSSACNKYRRVFCNPPYSDVDGFLRKGLYHLANGDCELLVYLLPSTTGNGWFHDYCLKGEVRFIRGRLRFGGAKYTAPFWSCIVIFREWAMEALPLEAA